VKIEYTRAHSTLNILSHQNSETKACSIEGTTSFFNNCFIIKLCIH